MNKQQRLIVLGLIVSIAVAAGLRAWLHPPLYLQAAQLLPVAKPIDGYGLTVGETKISFDQLKGHWALVFFGYTSCADVCPLELQKLGQLLKHFDAEAATNKPIVVFISVDPERDKPELLKKYVSYFHEDMVGVTGSNAELASLVSFFGASLNRTATINGKDFLIEAGADMPSTMGQHYVVNHSSRVFIIDPKVQYVGSFAPPLDTATLIADMEQLLRQ